MNINSLFPKRKRVVGYNTETGKRTAFALRKSNVWVDMMLDIAGCATPYELQKCRWYWAARVVADLWPAEWVALANEEFDKAVESVAWREPSE